MAKNMAQITDGIVTNVLWCSDRQTETDDLKDCMGKPVAIGDTYRNGDFYRGGKRILSEHELLLDLMREMAEAEYTTDDDGNIYHKEVGTDGEIHLVLIESYTGELFQ